MTTKVRIEPTGHHVLVTVTDKVTTPGVEPGFELRHAQTLLQPAWRYVEQERVQTGQGPWEGWATTSRSINVRDLEPDDPRVLAANGALNAPITD